MVLLKGRVWTDTWAVRQLSNNHVQALPVEIGKLTALKKLLVSVVLSNVSVEADNCGATAGQQPTRGVAGGDSRTDEAGGAAGESALHAAPQVPHAYLCFRNVYSSRTTHFRPRFVPLRITCISQGAFSASLLVYSKQVC